MPNYSYRGRDVNAQLKIGERSAASADELSNQLIKEGTYPIQIEQIKSDTSLIKKLNQFFINKSKIHNDLLVFSRQMKLLYQAGVPVNDSLRQLAQSSKSSYFATVLNKLAESVEKGHPLSSAMKTFPDVFTSICYNIIKIGESSGQLGESFGYLFEYLEFDANSKKELKAVFRYPVFVLSTIIIAFITLNIFVIPTFAKMYQGLSVSLPWETRLLIGFSNFIVNYSLILLVFLILAGYGLYYYIHTPAGRYAYDKFILKIPIFGVIVNRLVLVRFSRLMCIILDAGLSINEGLQLVKKTIDNAYVESEISTIVNKINQGVSFTKAIKNTTIFTSFEMQILSVGEQNGDLSPGLKYISDYHSQELKFDVKRISDLTGPVLISITAILVLIMALGIYLPVWNMINLTK